MGMVWTIALSVISIGIGTILGILWGLLLSTRKPNWLEVRWLGVALNDVVRALPLLILLLLINYCAPPLFGLRSTFWIAVLALAVNLAAFVGDVLRGAIAGVPQPLQDAGLAIGLSDTQVMRRIILPEAVRSVIPSIALLYIDILKMTSLASIIALPELTYVGGQVSSVEFRPLEVFVLIAVMYAAIIIPMSHFQRWLERSPWFIRRG